MQLSQIMRLSESAILNEDLGNLKSVNSKLLKIIMTMTDGKKLNYNVGRESKIEEMTFKNTADVFKAVAGYPAVIIKDKDGSQVISVSEHSNGYKIIVLKSFVQANVLPDNPDRKSWEKVVTGWEDIESDKNANASGRGRWYRSPKVDKGDYLESATLGKVALSSLLKNVFSFIGTKSVSGFAITRDSDRTAKSNKRREVGMPEPVIGPKDEKDHDDSNWGSGEYGAFLRGKREELKKRLELYKGSKSISFADISEVQKYFTTATKFDEKIKVDGFIYILSEYGDGEAGKKYGMMRGGKFTVKWNLESDSPKYVKLEAMAEAAKAAKDKQAMKDLAELFPPESITVTFKAVVDSVKADGKNWRARDLLKDDEDE